MRGMTWQAISGRPWDALTCAYAAQGGHLEVLRWLRAQGRGSAFRLNRSTLYSVYLVVSEAKATQVELRSA